MFAKLWRRLWKWSGVTPARSFILALELLCFATLDWLSLGNSELFVKKTRKSAFDPKIVFAKVGEHRNIRRIRLFCHRVTLRTFTPRRTRSSSLSFLSGERKQSQESWNLCTFFGEGRLNGRPLRVTTA
jgi:hypothetical protein